MKPGSRLALASLALVTVTAVAGAQDVASMETSVSVPTALAQPAGPRLDAARAGVQAVAPAFTAEPAPMRKKENIKGRNLMILGGAAILGGAVVGGDAGGIVSFAGLVVGLYGLYVYLN